MKSNIPLLIFMVDDDPFCLALYRQYLKNIGEENVVVFSDSSECLDNLSRNPDLIFLDHSMGPINGIDTLKKIKRIDPNATVVFISGQENIPVAVNALKYGALDYLTKELVTEERLTGIIEKTRVVKRLINGAKKSSWLKKLTSR
jgi:DNA-binding NtrC family response regulator